MSVLNFFYCSTKCSMQCYVGREKLIALEAFRVFLDQAVLLIVIAVLVYCINLMRPPSHTCRHA